MMAIKNVNFYSSLSSTKKFLNMQKVNSKNFFSIIPDVENYELCITRVNLFIKTK